MKKIIIIFVIILLFLGNIYPEDELLFKIYKSIYSKINTSTSLPRIYKKNNTYITIDDKEQPFNWELRIFDTKNYYIELALEGADGANHVYFAVYLSKDKKPVIGVSIIKESLYELFTFYNFFKFNGIYTVDVTNKVMPKISLENFFPEKYDIKDVPLNIFCELPRKGTITSIKLISHYSEDALLDVESIKNKVKKAQSAKIKDSFSFKWNYNKGIFELVK